MKKIIGMLFFFTSLIHAMDQRCLERRFSKKDYIMYCAARAITKIIFNHPNITLDKNYFYLNENFYMEYLPPAESKYSLQTSQVTTDGLVIEYDDGIPRLIWTPWGTWRFGGDGIGYKKFKNEVCKYFLQKVKTTPYKANQQLNGLTVDKTVHGELYNIHQVNDEDLYRPNKYILIIKDVALPYPVIQNNSVSNMEKWKQWVKWKQMTEQYDYGKIETLYKPSSHFKW